MHGLTFANRPNVRRSVRFRETCPLPMGVAKGPLRAMLFFLMLLMEAVGMLDLPSTKTGCTSISSHSMGTLACEKILLTDSLISGPIPSPGMRETR